MRARCDEAGTPDGKSSLAPLHEYVEPFEVDMPMPMDMEHEIAYDAHDAHDTPPVPMVTITADASSALPPRPPGRRRGFRSADSIDSTVVPPAGYVATLTPSPSGDEGEGVSPQADAPQGDAVPGDEHAGPSLAPARHPGAHRPRSRGPDDTDMTADMDESSVSGSHPSHTYAGYPHDGVYPSYPPGELVPARLSYARRKSSRASRSSGGMNSTMMTLPPFEGTASAPPMPVLVRSPHPSLSSRQSRSQPSPRCRRAARAAAWARSSSAWACWRASSRVRLCAVPRRRPGRRGS
jgi:hypothetical protein